MPGPKEDLYDEKISPLMTQILALCKEHKIAMAAQFLLDPEEGDEERPLCCTSYLIHKETSQFERERISSIEKVMKPKPSFMAFTIITNPK